MLSLQHYSTQVRVHFFMELNRNFAFASQYTYLVYFIIVFIYKIT